MFRAPTLFFTNQLGSLITFFQNLEPRNKISNPFLEMTAVEFNQQRGENRILNAPQAHGK
jgi:hypothetical protein